MPFARLECMSDLILSSGDIVCRCELKALASDDANLKYFPVAILDRSGKVATSSFPACTNHLATP
jgi:hypothetical protein